MKLKAKEPLTLLALSRLRLSATFKIDISYLIEIILMKLGGILAL